MLVLEPAALPNPQDRHAVSPARTRWFVKPSRLGLADAALPGTSCPMSPARATDRRGERSSILLPVLSRTRRTAFSEPAPT